MFVKGLPLKFEEGLPPVRVLMGEAPDTHASMVPCLFRKDGLCVIEMEPSLFVIIHETSGLRMSAPIQKEVQVMVAVHALCGFGIDWKLELPALEAVLLSGPPPARELVAHLLRGTLEFEELPMRGLGQA